jgi:hypothetical protein
MMKVSIYNQHLQRIDEKILELKRSRDAFVEKNREDVMDTIYNRQTNDRQWFIQHFSQVYRRRKEFALGTPNASVVIDCFTIYSIGSCCGYRSIKRLPIGQLVKLWEMGFKYQGCPVVEYIKHNGNHRINYIKSNRLLTKRYKYGEMPPFSNALQTLLKRLRNVYESTDYYRTIENLSEALKIKA